MLSLAGVSIFETESCSPAQNIIKITVDNNKITVPLSLFENTNLQIVRPHGSMYDIALRKDDDKNFIALLLQCTHQDNALNVLPMGFSCSLHGSEFNTSGAVVKGPASLPLISYKAEIMENNVVVFLA